MNYRKYIRATVDDPALIKCHSLQALLSLRVSITDMRHEFLKCLIRLLRVDRVEWRVIFSALCFSIAGCSTHLVSDNYLERQKQYVGMGHLYYIGSDSKYHYFSTRYIWKLPKTFRVIKSDTSLEVKKFLLTSKKEKWVPYLHDLNIGQSGFKR